MRFRRAPIEPREDEPGGRFRVNEKLGSNQKLHHILQQDMMRKLVERLELKHLIVDGFISRFSVSARRRRICDSSNRIAVRDEPPLLRENVGDLSQQRIKISRRQ